MELIIHDRDFDVILARALADTRRQVEIDLVEEHTGDDRHIDMVVTNSGSEEDDPNGFVCIYGPIFDCDAEEYIGRRAVVRLIDIERMEVS